MNETSAAKTAVRKMYDCDAPRLAHTRSQEQLIATEREYAEGVAELDGMRTGEGDGDGDWWDDYELSERLNEDRATLNRRVIWFAAESLRANAILDEWQTLVNKQRRIKNTCPMTYRLISPLRDEFLSPEELVVRRKQDAFFSRLSAPGTQYVESMRRWLEENVDAVNETLKSAGLTPLEPKCWLGEVKWASGGFKNLFVDDGNVGVPKDVRVNPDDFTF